MQIDELEPQQMGLLYGRTCSTATRRLFRQVLPPGAGGARKNVRRWILRATFWRASPGLRIASFSFAVLVLVLVLAQITGVLLGPRQLPYPLGLYRSGVTPKAVALPLLADPVGLLVILNSLAVPFFCAQQVKAIAIHNGINAANVADRAPNLNIANLNIAVEHANRAYKMLGTWWGSLLILVSAYLESKFLVGYVASHGLMANWSPAESLKTDKWRTLVYEGWWANPKHLVMHEILVVLGAYLFYHLTKQVAMGVVFAVFARSSLSRGLGVSPNLTVNTDGYYGLRDLRYFMQWTYATSLLDFLMTVGVMLVWLSFSALAVLMIGIVLVTNLTTVIYPSIVAAAGSIQEKKEYIRCLQITGDEKQRAVDRVWAAPLLPFRVRGAVSATALYLLFPTLLLVVSTLVKAK